MKNPMENAKLAAEDGYLNSDLLHDTVHHSIKFQANK